jgi:hypothetical protein
MMRRLSDIVAQIAADRLRERIESTAQARKEAALFAWQTMGDMPYLKMLNMIEARIHSRTDPDPAALRYLGHRLCRMADEAERRQEASGDRAQPPSPLASIYKAGL